MKTYFTFMKESHTLYHSSYTSAINAALQKHSDLNVSDEDRDTHIAMGPRKPAEGETVKHHIPATDKSGDKHMIHIQVYNKGGNKPFELNTYSSKISKKKVAEELTSTLGNVAKLTVKKVVKPAANFALKKVVKPAAKHVFNVVKHGVMRSILEDPTEMRHSSDSLGDHMALKAYTDKLGPKHIDRHDLLTAASHMAFGNMDHLKKHLKALDTDVRDKALEYVARRHHAELGYRVRKEEVDQIDELSLETMRSAKQKLAGRAKNAAMDDNKYLARREANRALNIGAKIKRKERQAATNEESDYIGYNFGGQFKDSSEWENAAKKRGLVVKLSTHPSGEVIKYQIAKDKSGNNRGHFDHGTKSGRLTIDEALGTIKNMKAASKFNSNNVSDMLRGEKARKAGMAKVSTTKDIGYRVVDVGPGQKETVRSERNFKEEVELDENWNEGVSSTNSNLHKNAGRESENKAKIAKIKAGRYAKDSEGYNKLMSQHHTLKAKSIKHFYHAGMYGSKDSAKKDHDEQIKYSKEYKLNSVKEEVQQVYEEHMSEKDAESLAQRHVDAAISAKKSGNLAGYYAHAEASNYIRDKILTHTYSPKGIPSVKIRSTAKKLFRESDLAEKEEMEINELDRGGIISRYIRKASPGGSENFPKRKKGVDLALLKKWGDKGYGLPEPKVKAVQREEVEPLAEISAALVRRSFRLAMDE